MLDSTGRKAEKWDAKRPRHSPWPFRFQSPGCDGFNRECSAKGRVAVWQDWIYWTVLTNFRESVMLKLRLLWWVMLVCVVMVVAYAGRSLLPRPPTEEKLFRQIVPGMTESDVKKAIGRPSDIDWTETDVDLFGTRLGRRVNFGIRRDTFHYWHGETYGLIVRFSKQGVVTESRVNEHIDGQSRRPPWEKWLPPWW